MDTEEIVKKIKAVKWDNRVSRPGFLQSKAIVHEAHTMPVYLTKSILLKYGNQMWVKDHCLYDEIVTKSFTTKFDEAFEEDKDWPVHIIKKLDLFTEEKDELVKELLRVKKIESEESRKNSVSLFTRYRNLLHSIQKYYVIAVPLTSYCESQLKIRGVDPMPLAVSYKKFDVDWQFESIKKIQTTKGVERALLTKKHLEKYAWIKTGYNIISPYTEKDLTEELEKEMPISNHSFTLPKDSVELAIGLQVGIYLRTRMKEMSQQLWYAVEGLGNAMAKTIGIARDDFFQLLFQEAIDSFKEGRSVVSQNEIKARHRGFAVGFLGGFFVLLTGPSVDDLDEFYDSAADASVTEIRGQTACKGLVRGKVRVVLSRKDFAHFETGEVLVASSTTPDYILLMKKAVAIVTNEGGLSSHAAIVSRELVVPCVIGTKIATKVLKDGDEVEVNANIGVVKIIKRATE